MVTDTATYHFVTRWRLSGTCGEVADIIADAGSLPRWWPSVYLQVEELTAGDPRGIGRRLRLWTKGWLPYTLCWIVEVVDSRYPNGLTLDAHGDFEGRGVWNFRQDGPDVDITYDWRVRAEKPLLRRLSPILKPLFAANHRWPMAQGEESLRLELARRRALSGAARAEIPPPPGPVTYAAVVVIGVAATGAAALGYLMYRATRTGRGSASYPPSSTLP